MIETLESLSNHRLHDYMIKDIIIDYANGKIRIYTLSPKNIEKIFDFVNVLDFSITDRKPWGEGIYIVTSIVDKTVEGYKIEIQLNSGDEILLTIKE